MLKLYSTLWMMMHSCFRHPLEFLLFFSNVANHALPPFRLDIQPLVQTSTGKAAQWVYTFVKMLLNIVVCHWVWSDDHLVPAHYLVSWNKGAAILPGVTNYFPLLVFSFPPCCKDVFYGHTTGAWEVIKGLSDGGRLCLLNRSVIFRAVVPTEGTELTVGWSCKQI